MPYTFVEIEARRRRRIVLLFATLLVVYLAGALLVSLALLFPTIPFSSLLATRFGQPTHAPLFGLGSVLGVVAAALGACLLHWSLSVRGMVRRTLDLIGAQQLDPKDRYHRELGNIVAEVVVATGGRKIRGVVVSSRWMNAFAVADFQGRGVIGVSERLLVRLDRAELEAVVGHEAAHLVDGDSLLSTVSCSMAAVWAGLLRALIPGDQEEPSRVSLSPNVRRVGFVVAVVALMRGLTVLLNAWISREREYRADATAVRLTRDPLALARALHSISGDSRPVSLAEDELGPLFIVDRSRHAAEKGSSPLLSTHPPVERRIEVLLGMAHANRNALEGERTRPAPPTDAPSGEPVPPQRWFACQDSTWRGPFTAAELAALPWFGPFTPVSPGEPRLASPAWEHAEINRLLKKIDVPASRLGACPACGGALCEVAYEGVPLHKCGVCSGRLVTRERFARILARGEPQLPPDVHALALQFVRRRPGRNVDRRLPTLPAPEGPHVRCPACSREMVRVAYAALLPRQIMIGHCDPCGLLWFDAKELEMIQDVLAIFGD